MHCILYHQTLAAKKENSFKNVPDDAVKRNFNKSLSLSTHIFNSLCDTMGSTYKALCYVPKYEGYCKDTDLYSG